MAVRPRSLTSAEIRASAQPGTILLMRDNAVVYDGGDTRVTKEDYGNGFKAALAAAQAGDTILLGPGEFELANAAKTVNNLRIIGNRTKLRSNAAYDFILKLTGNSLTLQGIDCDGGEDANDPPGGDNAWGFSLEGDDIRFIDCSADGITSNVVGFGSGLLVNASSRFYSEGYRSQLCHYAGFILDDTPDAKMVDTTVINPKNRVASTRSSSPVNRIEFEGLYGYMSAASSQIAAPGINWNHAGLIGASGRLGELVLKRVHMHAEDIFNDVSNRELMKFQGIDRLFMDDVNFEHSANAGSGNLASFVLEAATYEPVKEIYAKNVRCSGHVDFNFMPVEFASFEQCHFGLDHVGGGINWWDPAIKRLRVKQCTFNMHAGSRAISTPNPFPADYDWDFDDNLFTGDDASILFVILGNYLNEAAGRIRFPQSNRLVNVNSGGISKTNTRVSNLICSTDKNGNLLWDESIAAPSGSYNVHPEPGAGPNFFPDVPVGPEGTRIYNIRYKTTGSSFPRYWISNGTNWVAV